MDPLEQVVSCFTVGVRSTAFPAGCSMEECAAEGQGQQAALGTSVQLRVKISSQL